MTYALFVATQMLCTMLSNTFTALDSISLAPIVGVNVSMLDTAIIIPAVIARTYEFLLFLSGQDEMIEPPEIPPGMYG